ncbi:hypothetical protein K504DRAFT_529601 [Pleomassaria siparia CBS 279.74]|uniref:Uncharacterized protein n=1 Tax=Pleomassaria siparia CBS 279.74 TaxID=1314801 RepID=A0A6G1KRE2_9PLEO|nr:hypothetical protein K504DRAFT_529601 [Pleomassaria siparia CBS 279.74]
MATLARPVSSLEATTPSDAMELLSDGGYDLENGDIDIEFDTATHHQDDDDLTLHDAAPDTELDLYTTLPDQDDFMIDKEDLIDEDEVEYGDVEVVDAVQPPIESPRIQHEVTIDDDLIDYSDEEDEEDEQPQVTREASLHVDQGTEQQGAPVESVDSQSGLDVVSTYLPEQTADEIVEQAEEENELAQEPEPDQNTLHIWDDAESGWEQTANDEYITRSHTDSEHDEHHEEQLEERVPMDENNVDQHVQLDELAEDDQSAETKHEPAVEHIGHVDTPLHTLPVTINYDGSEFWLFKPDTSEDDDDWLLEDHSLQKKPMTDLFQACRFALRNDVTNETELGFRFDHFHNMELFEDSTPCLVLDLDRLIGTYLKLHAQDGTPNPESFYVTLQFRPRVLTLVGELEKAVRDGIGYSGLGTAVAAGQTAFNTPFSNDNADDTHEEWDEEEKVEHSTETAQQEEDREEVGGHQVFPLETTHNEEQNEESSEDPTLFHEQQRIDTHAASREDEEKRNETDQSKIIQEEAATTPSNNTQTPAATYPVEEDGDIIDYSDDDEEEKVAEEEEAAEVEETAEEEDPIDAAQPDQASVHNPSSASSTVRGDDVVDTNDDVQDPINTAEANEDDGQTGYNSAEGQGDGQDGHVDLEADFANDEGYPHEQPSTYDDDAFNEEYSQGYGDDASYQAFEAGDYLAHDAHAEQEADYYKVAALDQQEGDYYKVAALDQQEADYYKGAALDQQEDLNFPQDEDHDDNLAILDPAIKDDEFVDLDAAFDVNGGETAADEEASHIADDGGTNDVVEDDYINYDDDENEDGAVEQLTVASSAAAQPVATSSTGLDHEGSPQGQKRSIDEVGNGLDNGTDLSGSFDPSSWFPYGKHDANVLYADAKRPRV